LKGASASDSGDNNDVSEKAWGLMADAQTKKEIEWTGDQSLQHGDLQGIG
jgi:hypothetical protein